ncbi:ribonuclease BN [Halogeometricum sp. S1BR25-6]|uniref:Ribonuclease BN n=1 Tax=Halogeometricum salsisoli TaxID=2950536 RepID=A0ABU2GCL1_9EURY|nr:ribonuclease BN [Halogeometricum sp. S1BR25-6]MDS0297973.1 ribonuclease BN [Halogeometricum sp. S1BR25-6]
MTSLSEAYHTGERAGPSLRRLSLGLGVFLFGVALVVAGIVVATTDLLLGDMTLGGVRELGGILAGVGVPMVFLGIFTVTPSSRLAKAAAVVGAGIALAGVALFRYAYPCRWSGATGCPPGYGDLTLLTVGIYFLGALTTFWCLFVGVANFKTRNAPGGTATVEVTKKGETRYVEVNRSRGLGGIGFLGGTPDSEAETQTGTSGTVSDGGTDPEPITSPQSSSDGAQSPTGPRGPQSPAGDRSQSQSQAQSQSRPADVYCGNCAHFDYVRTDDGIVPYCGYHEELMDDMEACDRWTPRGEQ